METSIDCKQQFAEKQGTLKKAKVLIVDDEASIRILIRDILIETGYEVWEAKSGEDALSKVKEITFNLLITDIRMPGMSGLELLQKVKIRCPDIEVIVITGHHESEHEQYCVAHGAADFITKSSAFEKLLASIHRTLEKQGLN